MHLFNHRTIYSTVFYILTILLVMLSKPSIMFNEDGQIKQFGVGNDNKTIISLGVANGVLALFSFYVFTVIDVIFAQRNAMNV